MELQNQSARKVSIICSRGGLDECYPALILANAARQSGIDAMVFFTFWGLDVITEKKVDHLHVNLAGNPASGMPTIVGGLPGMESLAAKMMMNSMEKLDLPTVREMIEILEVASSPCRCLNARNRSSCHRFTRSLLPVTFTISVRAPRSSLPKTHIIKRV